MARHPRTHARITTAPRYRRVLSWIRTVWDRYRPETQYHRTHPVFMAYAYCSAGAAVWIVATVWRGIA